MTVLDGSTGGQTEWATDANAVNQIAYLYDPNAWGALIGSFQEHNGVVDADSNSVRHVFADVSAAADGNYPRLSAVVYPNGRTVYYNYPASGVGAVLDRVDNVASGPSPQTADKR